jgi:pSer/pThr/pTyr-binding forkhead associated (FHA) protein
MPKLILQFKGAFIQEQEIDKPSILIGRREGNDIKIDNLAVSGNHAKIQKVNDSYLIVDLKSTNGTFVNRKKVVQAKLNHEDEIIIGKHTLIFEHEEQAGLKKEKQEEAHPEPEPQEKDAAPNDKGLPEKSQKVQTGKIETAASINFISEPIGPAEIKLTKKLTIIGKREDADIKLKGAFAPKVAAMISKKPSGFSILPSEEKSKVKVNGDQISKQTDLSDGDIIEVGSVKLVFSAQ